MYIRQYAGNAFGKSGGIIKINKKILSNSLHTDFNQWVSELKTKISDARRKAVFTLNAQLIHIYWEIGKDLAEKIQDSWGKNTIEKIATELRTEFPDMKGFSRRNLYAIRPWYLFYSQKYAIVPHTVAQIQNFKKPRSGDSKKCINF